MAADGVSHGLKRAVLGGERGVGRQLLFEGEGVGGVEFAVQGGVEAEASRVGGGFAHGSALMDLRARRGRGRGAT